MNTRMTRTLTRKSCQSPPRINGQIQQVNVIEGQVVYAGDVLAVIDQREYGIAVCKALADLAYAENNAAITVTSAYGGLNSAHAAAKRAQREPAAAEYKLRTDEAALKRADVVATDRQ